MDDAATMRCHLQREDRLESETGERKQLESGIGGERERAAKVRRRPEGGSGGECEETMERGRESGGKRGMREGTRE
ncbi:hypothetical protein Syun_028389 [Stephania yunnanensis]|uniref:Uncharacterized protein n=1 Tax=Stephania yunnanensis TaxID=152371 RepID=A0AAP0HLV7_9MAGN